jgi:integrase
MARHGDGIYKRGNVWRLDCIINGRRRIVTLGKNIKRSDALEIASVKRAAILKGDAGIGSKKYKDMPFDKAKEDFLKWIEANKAAHTLKSCKTHMKALLDSFQGKKLSEITPFLIEKHKIKRLHDDCPVALNRELAYLKLLFNCFRDWRKYEGENPVMGIKGPKESEGRTRHLTQEEEGRLLGAAKEPLRTLIILGTNTGLRIEAEALTLRWDNLDLEEGYLTVEGAYSKNHETATIPLNNRAVEALKTLKTASRGEYVFVGRNGKPLKSIRTAFTTACNHAKLSGVTPHVLRHTFASRLGEAGVSDGTIQALGRWKEARMIRRYKHLTETHLREAVEKISKNIPPVFTPAQKAETRKSLCARSSAG